MATFKDILGTISSPFSVGNGASGVKKLRFKNSAAVLDLQANPIAATNITFPGANGDLVTNLDGFYNARCSYFNHFTRSGGFRGFLGDNSGAGAAQSALSTPSYDRPGVISNSTGTTTTGRSAITSVASSMRLGFGRCLCETALNIPALSNSTQRFKVIIGFVNILSGNQPSEGVYWRYGDNDNTGKWQAVCTTGGVETTIDSGVTVAAATWYNLAVDINSDGSIATFWLNNSIVGTITTNIPLSTAIQSAVSIRKTAGTTARTVQIDYFYAGMNL